MYELVVMVFGRIINLCQDALFVNLLCCIVKYFFAVFSQVVRL